MKHCRKMTNWTVLFVPRSDYWHVRNLGADTEPRSFRLWITATQARSKTFRPWLDTANQRTFTVDVAFDERDQAKQNRCFWDATAKSWSFATCRPDKDLPAFVLTRRGRAPRVWLFNMPFALKDEAKAAGFLWDGQQKKWYMRADRFNEGKLPESLRKYAGK